MHSVLKGSIEIKGMFFGSRQTFNGYLLLLDDGWHVATSYEQPATRQVKCRVIGPDATIILHATVLSSSGTQLDCQRQTQGLFPSRHKSFEGTKHLL